MKQVKQVKKMKQMKQMHICLFHLFISSASSASSAPCKSELRRRDALPQTCILIECFLFDTYRLD